MIKQISSTENKQFKNFKKLLKSGEREKTKLFIAEGKRLVNEALEENFCEALILLEGFEIPQNIDIPVYIMSNKCFKEISTTENSQGIIAICKQRDYSFDNLNKIVICDGVSDPGNLGTIIRTVEASGFQGVGLIGGVDPYNPKVVRSTMGSIFRIPVKKINIDDFLDYEIIVTALENSQNIYETEFSDKVALVIGNEAKGVSENILSKADKKIKIPMFGRVESLNAAISAAVAMYEISRREL